MGLVKYLAYMLGSIMSSAMSLFGMLFLYDKFGFSTMLFVFFAGGILSVLQQTEFEDGTA